MEHENLGDESGRFELLTALAATEQLFDDAASIARAVDIVIADTIRWSSAAIDERDIALTIAIAERKKNEKAQKQ